MGTEGKRHKNSIKKFWISSRDLCLSRQPKCDHFWPKAKLNISKLYIKISNKIYYRKWKTHIVSKNGWLIPKCQTQLLIRPPDEAQMSKWALWNHDFSAWQWCSGSIESLNIKQNKFDFFIWIYQRRTDKLFLFSGYRV